MTTMKHQRFHHTKTDETKAWVLFIKISFTNKINTKGCLYNLQFVVSNKLLRTKYIILNNQVVLIFQQKHISFIYFKTGLLLKYL